MSVSASPHKPSCSIWNGHSGKQLTRRTKKHGITIYRAKFMAERLYEIEYVNPYNGKKISVMLRTDYDEDVMKLLDTIGLKH